MITIAPHPYQSTTGNTFPAITGTETSPFATQIEQLRQHSNLSNDLPDTTTHANTWAPNTLAQQSGNEAIGVSVAVKNFIEWQGAQPNPLGQGTVADVWAKQGITDPMNNTVLIGQAINQLNRAEQRSAMNPNFVAQWSGDWKTQMAQRQATETERQSRMTAADVLGNVSVGGGHASHATQTG